MRRTRQALLISALFLAIGSAVPGPGPAMAQIRAASEADCFGEDHGRRIDGCTAFLAQPGLTAEQQSMALSQRALAWSLRAEHDRAIRDYDEALQLNAYNATAWNNRAWSYFKTGRVARALPDVERSLELSPTSAHALDTRAHIRQWNGNRAQALADYRAAIHYGATRMVRLYQCGLQERGLYSGPIDGIYTEALWAAMERCVEIAQCDPLPADEECRDTTS